MTAFILELFWLEYETDKKSGFETSLEHRLKKFCLRTNDATNQHLDDLNKRKSTINKLIKKTIFNDKKRI